MSNPFFFSHPSLSASLSALALCPTPVPVLKLLFLFPIPCHQVVLPFLRANNVCRPNGLWWASLLPSWPVAGSRELNQRLTPRLVLEIREAHWPACLGCCSPIASPVNARMSSWTIRLLCVLLPVLAVLTVQAVDLDSLDPSLLKNVDVDKLKESYLPEGLRNATITLADLRELLRSKCEKANPGKDVDAAALSGAIETAVTKLGECLAGLANFTAIQQEIEEASPKGDLDIVFEKYCKRMPQAKACINDFNAALIPCLTREEKSHNTMMRRITDKLLDFVCYKDGDQIALFIAEQGPECLQQSRDGIGNCFNATFSGYLPKELTPNWTSGSDLPHFVLGPSQCLDLYEFETCTVKILERCENITPSNLVESLFRYVRRESSCQSSIDKARRSRALPLGAEDGVGKSGAGAGAGSLTFGFASLLLTSLVLGRLS